MTIEEPRPTGPLGVLLGNYRILSKLGEGGMGEVYLGRHEALGHRVAVKVLHLELSRQADMVRRFFKEAQAATAIRNLGIVQVFDFGTAPDGRAYFVMELLEGQSLAARLKQRRPGYLECCRIGRQIANVLQDAHAACITHRDLKPDNLFLIRDAEAMGGERVKVLDFGIAKLAGSVQASGVRTRTGLLMGTPYYMSPEQCRGAGAVDARSDIYSLGCILFEMICGRPPFLGEGDGEIVGAHQFLEPPHPQSLVPDIPPGLGTLIAHMLAKRPDARPQAMLIVSQVLDEILQTLGAPLPAPTSLPVPSPMPSPIPIPTTSPRPWPEPSSRPSPALLPSPASTTLGSAAGMASIRGVTRTRRFWVVLGGLVVVATVSVLGLAIGGADSPEQQISKDATVDPSASAHTPDAHQVVANPPLSPDAVEALAPLPDASVEIDTRSSELEIECLRYRAYQKWDDLDSCAERLKATNPVLAKELKARATLEINAGPRINAFEIALRDRNLKQARSELESIGNVTQYAKLRQQYEQAQNVVIQDVVMRLERAKDGDCKEYNLILQQEKLLKPQGVVEKAMILSKCTPVAAPTCDHEALSNKGRQHYTIGNYLAALEFYEKAWNCKADPLYAEKAFINACNLQSRTDAQVHWKRMTPAMRRRALEICERNGIQEHVLAEP